MNTTLRKTLGTLAVAALVAYVAVSPTTRSLLEDWTQGLGSAAAGNAGYTLTVQMVDDTGRDFDYTRPLTKRELRDLQNRPERARKVYITEATKAFAVKMGYTESRYGADFYKMVRPEVTSIKVADVSRGRSRELFRDERRLFNFERFYGSGGGGGG